MNRNKSCNSVESLLWDYDKGTLSETEISIVRRHLAECGQCRASLAASSRAGRLFDVYGPPLRSAAPADWRDLEVVLKDRQRPRFASKRLALFATATAIVVVILSRGYLIRDPSPNQVAINTSGYAGPVKPVPTQERRHPHQSLALLPGYRSTGEATPEGSSRRAGSRISAAPGHFVLSGHPSVYAANADGFDEMREVNADSATVLAGWNTRVPDAFVAEMDRIEKSTRAGDDFIDVPRPMLASADTTPAQRRSLLTVALAEYRKQKQIMDPRLNRNVSIGSKSISFDTLCKQLKEKTEIDIRASRSVMDDNITLFCKDQPVREIMRQINRVFGFTWSRTGEEGAYQYTLVQDLRSQLAEEEMRNWDINEAFLAIDSKIETMNPDKKFSQWGALQMYKQLSPADYANLRSGGSIKYSGWDTVGGRPLPPEIDEQLVKANTPLLPQPAEITYPDYHADVTFSINRSELGQLSLQADTGVFKVGHGGYGGPSTLAVGQSPSVAKPQNAEANKALASLPELQTRVTLHPTPTCPVSAERVTKRTGDENKFPPDGKHQSLDRFNRGMVGFIHIVPADAWEEIHRKTGMPIIADSFTRLHRVGDGSVENASLFDALNKVADSLGTRWKKDGAFIQLRTTSFFWDRLKEVPNRLLVRWQEDSRMKSGLPLDDFLQMANLSDQQLSSHTIGDAIVHCWGLSEWDSLDTPMGYYSARPFIRFLSKISPDMRQKFERPEGVAFSGMSAILQDEFTEAARAIGRSSYINLSEMPQCRYRMEYIPAGVYVWRPDLKHDRQLEVTITDSTLEGALAKARKIDPNAAEGKIKRSPGSFTVIQYNAKGEASLVAGVKTHLLFNAFGGND